MYSCIHLKRNLLRLKGLQFWLYPYCAIYLLFPQNKNSCLISVSGWFNNDLVADLLSESRQKVLICTKIYLLWLEWQTWLNPHFVSKVSRPKIPQKLSSVSGLWLAFLRLYWIFFNLFTALQLLYCQNQGKCVSWMCIHRYFLWCFIPELLLYQHFLTYLSKCQCHNVKK